MIKVWLFDCTDEPIVFYSEATTEQFLEWSNGSKIVALVEKDTNALFTIPINKYIVKVQEVSDEENSS